MENNEKAPETVLLGDINVTAVWKNVNSQYVSSRALFIGKLKVVEYYYNGTRSKGDPKQYTVSSSVPCLKSDLGDYETVQECESRCVDVVKHFFKQLQGI